LINLTFFKYEYIAVVSLQGITLSISVLHDLQCFSICWKS